MSLILRIEFSLVIVFPFLSWRKLIIIVSVQKTRGELGCGYVCVCACVVSWIRVIKHTRMYEGLVFYPSLFLLLFWRLTWYLVHRHKDKYINCFCCHTMISFAKLFLITISIPDKGKSSGVICVAWVGLMKLSLALITSIRWSGLGNTDLEYRT